MTESDAPTAERPAVASDILEIFAAEAEEHLLTVSRNLPILQRHPTSDEHLQEIRRAFHTLKGAAASVGFAPLARLSHRAEDLLDRLSDSRRPATEVEFTLLFDSLDALEGLAGGCADGDAVAVLYPRYDAALSAAYAPATAPDEPPLAVPAPDVPAPDADDGVPASADAGRAAGESLRVPIVRLDEVGKLLGELVISRTGFEQRLAKYARVVQDLQLSCGRLGRATAKMESRYEAKALGGGRLGPHFDGPSGRAPGVAGHGFDGLELDQYSDFHLLTRELAETSTDLGGLAQEFAGLAGEFDGYLLRQSRLSGDLQDKLTRVRMVPLTHLSARLHRTARQTAAAVGKRVRLVLAGEATELDKTVLEEMSEPLLHLLRNAIDHGVEPAAERVALGKPAAGTVRVEACREGTQVVIRVSDDGRGVDPEAVRAAAAATGLLPPDEAARLSPDALLDLLFVSGFSTAAAVTETSGRGVGLDSVKVMVGRLKGTVGLASTPGRGATFTVRLPLTLAVIRALVVKAAGQTFAVPLAAVAHILRLDPEAADRIGGEDVARVAGRTHPRLTLAALMGLEAAPGSAGPRPPAVVLAVGDRRYVVVVDEVVGGREVVVKTLGTHLRRVSGVAGATLLGDGSVVLILDPLELFAAHAPGSAHAAPAQAAASARPSRDAPTVLVVDDSPSVRRVVGGQLREAGWVALAAKDGVEALEALHRADRLPDAVLLDVEMPRMDGYELLSTLRASPTYAGLPVVMLTSRAGEKHRRKAAEVGATGYLVKPYQPAELLRTLQQAMDAARPAPPVTA